MPTTPSATRRRTAIGLSALLTVPFLRPARATTAAAPAASASGIAASHIAALAAIESRHGGRLGVFARDTAGEGTLAWRADERFTLCSTFKGLLAALILARAAAGQDDLAQPIAYTARDLARAGYPDFACPVTAARLGGRPRESMTVGELCQAAVEASDNLAAILLMRRAGGPAGLTRFVRTLGDATTRIDRYEPDANAYQGALDTTTPRAIVATTRAILLGNALPPPARARLESWMVAARPGRNRLRAALPPDWIAGDRPGTYGPEETNDIALVHPPGRAPLLVAAYYHAPTVPPAEREAVLRQVGAVFVDWAVSSR